MPNWPEVRDCRRHVGWRRNESPADQTVDWSTSLRQCSSSNVGKKRTIVAAERARTLRQNAHTYVADLINRDVMQLSEIERGAEMFTLANLVATRSGQLLAPGALARRLTILRKIDGSQMAAYQDQLSAI
ncbi:hypothetical protein [Nocardia amikacinitolerans]|uniref:hypothetical protein n=1 Tax=Nocardia amikacinitolerans TaxID=756689 RepID=UPI0020A54E7D|nr:hypothetical protein [Nocardia amikacinitolerans]